MLRTISYFQPLISLNQTPLLSANSLHLSEVLVHRSCHGLNVAVKPVKHASAWETAVASFHPAARGRRQKNLVLPSYPYVNKSSLFVLLLHGMIFVQSFPVDRIKKRTVLHSAILFRTRGHKCSVFLGRATRIVNQRGARPL